MPDTNMPSNSSRAPAPRTMDSSTSSSYDNVDSQHIKSEAKSTANDAEQKTKETADKAQGKSSEYAQTAKEKAKEAADYTKEKSGEFADSAERNYGKAKDSASKNAKEAKKEIKSAGQDLDDNKDNPVYIANGVLMVAGGAALGYGAYTKHQAGQLDWQLAAVWAGAVGALAIGDYYLSQYVSYLDLRVTKFAADELLDISSRTSTLRSRGQPMHGGKDVKLPRLDALAAAPYFKIDSTH